MRRLFFLSAIWLATVVAVPADQPNVLLIAIDDLNDWVGCLGGHPQAVTPNIDRLAAQGTLFTNAHCQGPICGPSRASLLSGKYPHATGIYQQPSGKPMELDREHFRGQLVPEVFTAHGYKTLGCGKITHGYSPQIAFHERPWLPLGRERSDQQTQSVGRIDPRAVDRRGTGDGIGTDMQSTGRSD